MFLPAVAVDPLNPAGRPTPANLASYGFRGARSVFRDDASWYSYHQALKRVGLSHIVTLARESFTLSRPDTIARLPVDCDYVVIGNEPDGEGPSSWKQSPAEFLALVAECSVLVRQRCPGVKVVAGGLVSGQPSWLVPIIRDLRPLVDCLDAHPYSKTPDEAAALLRAYSTLLGGLPLVVLEWNRPRDQIDGFLRMLAHTTEAAAFFAWSDGMVDGFGLVDRAGNPKHELDTMQAALLALPTVEPPPISPPENRPHYVLGFAEFAAAEPALVGEPLEDERGGVPAFSQQRTSRGILTAAKLEGQGWRLLFWEDATGSRYLFDGQRAERIA